MDLGTVAWRVAAVAATVGLAASCSASSDPPGPQPGGAAGVGGAGAAGGAGGLDAGPDADEFDAGFSDADPCGPDAGPDSGCECESLQFSIDTQQSCALSILPGFEMDGEGFIEIGGTPHRVFALDRWGSGHVVAWCDATTLPLLLDAFDVTGYLGQVPDPRVASFGDHYLCDPPGAAGGLPMTIQYQGDDLPAQYRGDAAALAADWDVIILCGFRMTWAYDWVQELGAFVSTHGKGLLAVGEYESLATTTDFQNLSNITSPAGIVFEPLNLPWAPAAAEVSLDCVPDLPPPPR